MNGNDAGAGHLRLPREEALSATFVLLADTLVDDFDIAELLDVLVAATVELLDVSAAALLLTDHRGGLAVAASSSEESRLLETFQLQAAQGPCLDCVTSGLAVASADLAQDIDRWPDFVPTALAAGFRSVLAVPLRLRDATVGSLNLLGAGPGLVPLRDRQLAQALADVATIGILQRRSRDISTVLADQLQHALNSRVAIEQAKGVLAERLGLSMDAAYSALRSYARNHNDKLTEVATAVVLGTLDIGRIGT